jgi:hypothetical protein
VFQIAKIIEIFKKLELWVFQVKKIKSIVKIKVKRVGNLEA